MKLLTWNLWNSFKRIENPLLVSFLEPTRRRERRYLHQLKLLHENAFDVCFLQEVNPVFDKARDFKDILRYQVTYQMDQGGLRYKEKQKKVRGLKLSGSFGANEDDYSVQFSEFRYALFSEIKKEDKKILLVNSHFHHGIEWSEALEKELRAQVAPADYNAIATSIQLSTDRKRQEIDLLTAEIRKLRSQYTHVIVAGDFNFSEGAQLLGAFKELELKRVEHQGFTWDHEVNHENFAFSNALRPPVGDSISQVGIDILRKYDMRHRTMDHIFVSSAVTVNSARLFGQVTNRDGYYPSDHFGVEVDVDL
jgi:endonuclease/exonuclease/phosphatase family metal-dependent hydrolase